jgi:hypothetical protein
LANLLWSKPGLELGLEPGQEIALVLLLITCQDLKAPTKSIR